MTWIVALLAVGLLCFIVYKSIDRETLRNLKHLSRTSAIVIGLIFLLAILANISQ